MTYMDGLPHTSSPCTESNESGVALLDLVPVLDSCKYSKIQ